MSVGSMISLFFPMVAGAIKKVIDRAWSNGVTTVQGTAAGAGVLGILQAAGCHLEAIPAAAIAVVSALPGVLATDANKTAPSLIQVATEAAKQTAADAK